MRLKDHICDPKSSFTSTHIQLFYQIYKQRDIKVRKGAKIRNRYNQVPHLTQDTNGKVTHLQVYTINESQEVHPFPADDHKAQINRRAQRHNKHKTDKTNNTQNKKPPWNERSVKYFTGRLKPDPRRQFDIEL